MVLLIVSVSTGFLLFGIGFLVNQKNAPSVISGYKQLPEKDKKQIRLAEYVKFFRIFHFFIGLSIVVFSILFYLLKMPDFIGLTLIFFSLAGYTFFIYKTQFYYPPQQRMIFKISFSFMLIISISVILMMYIFQIDPKVEIYNNQLKISGIYGENIEIQNIKEIHLLKSLPPISYKTNGVAMSHFKKGWFKLNDGRKVKLFVNDMSGPFIEIIDSQNKTIFIGLNDFDEELLYHQLSVLNQQSPE